MGQGGGVVKTCICDCIYTNVLSMADLEEMSAMNTTIHYVTLYRLTLWAIW